jgi:two-component system, cell cycle response regulator DivK
VPRAVDSVSKDVSIFVSTMVWNIRHGPETERRQTLKIRAFFPSNFGSFSVRGNFGSEGWGFESLRARQVVRKRGRSFGGAEGGFRRCAIVVMEVGVSKPEKKKVLVVEDHPDLRSILVRHIEWMGYAVVQAKDGAAVMEMALNEKPDLILLDIMMPDVDGWQAARTLRANPATQHIPILAVTALFRESDLKRCLEDGCSDYIGKPFNFEQLRQKVQEYIH